MKAASLFALFLFARGLMLAGRDLEWNAWMVVAFVWQDLAVAMAFWAIERVSKSRNWLWVLYGIVAIYIALNVPLVRTISSPMTAAMSRAAGGTLADSIAHQLTVESMVCVVATLVAAVVIPLMAARLSIPVSRSVTLAVAGIGCILVGLGPFATRRVETHGLGRNVVVTYVTSMRERVVAKTTAENWRKPIASAPVSRAPLAKSGAAKGRNIILIALESTGAKYLKPWGASDDPMPNLTRLAQQAMVFEHAYAVYPESIKGLYSVLCSQWPAFDARAEDYEHIATTSLAQELANNGYATAMFHSGRFDYLGMEEIIRNRGFDLLHDAGEIGGNHESSFGVDEPATVEHMLTWIDALPKDAKFLINYLPIAGHHPYVSHGNGPFSGEGEVSRYKNALYEGDVSLGVLVQGLKQRGLDTNTLFVIYGDHGEAFGEHEGNFGHTMFIYEENVRVPLLIAAPGLFKTQTRAGQVTSLVDVAPTVLDLVGLKSPSDWQGASLLEGTDSLALFYTDYSLGLLGLRDGRWKFIYELETQRSKLYDLSADPNEMINLAAKHPALTRAYTQRVRAWSSAQRASFVTLRKEAEPGKLASARSPAR